MATDFGKNGSHHEPQTSLEEIREWAALVGHWNFDGANAHYFGRESTIDQPSTHESRVSMGLALSPVVFRDGHVRCSVRLQRTESTTAGIAVGVRSASAPYVVAAIGGFNYAYSVLQHSPGRGFELVEGAGSLSNLAVHEQYDLEVILDGQVLRMKVNSVPVIETVLRSPLAGSGLGLFAFDTAEIVFESIRASKQAVKVFVMMPFTEPFDTLYDDVIKPEAEGLGFEIIRVDEIAGPGIILDDIRRQIERAHIVVAEISTPNPNVFYELGYAHALNKPAVLLARRQSEMPFDVRPYRAIFYDDSIGGKKLVQQQLRQHLKATLQSAT